ncbi:Uncharacterized protein Adt_03950 [Abeliophyllum distichum]|uniref:Retrotransposon gag domain-containing protein n=1 Tax=Abeliophyllum distichum TaxID=126358 RepID=A0ABD1W071_9LAMI
MPKYPFPPLLLIFISLSFLLKRNLVSEPHMANTDSTHNSASNSVVSPLLGGNHSSSFGMKLTQTPTVKLNKNNFLLWKNMVMPIICGQNLEGFILGTKLLMGWLYSSMSPEIAMRVMGSTSSSKLWTAIEKSYGIMNRSRIIFLTSELQRTRKGAMSIDQYLSTIKHLADNLEIAGKVNFVHKTNSYRGGRTGYVGRAYYHRENGRGRDRSYRQNEKKENYHICGLNNHSAKKCYNRYDERYMESRPSQL